MAFPNTHRPYIFPLFLKAISNGPYEQEKIRGRFNASNGGKLKTVFVSRMPITDPEDALNGRQRVRSAPAIQQYEMGARRNELSGGDNDLEGLVTSRENPEVGGSPISNYATSPEQDDAPSFAPKVLLVALDSRSHVFLPSSDPFSRTAGTENRRASRLKRGLRLQVAI